MYPLTISLIVVAGVLAHPGAAAGTTPAVRFWEEALPGTPMPDAIADLVQKGIDHSPLAEHYPIADDGTGDTVVNVNWNWNKCRRCQLKGADKGFYFLTTQVRVGTTLTFSIRRALIAPILPRDVADKVPFSDLASVLATFGVAPSSAEAATVEDTLGYCQSSPVVGEQKACATSLEATVESTRRMLLGGTDDKGRKMWAAASAIRSAGLPLQPYVIQAVTPLDGDRHLGCHILPYPYAVFYCHMMPAMPTKAYLVSLRGAGGGPAVTMAAICHLDTSNWDPSVPAFEMLHTHPGGAPVCHFLAYANLLFGEKAVAGKP